MIDQHSKTMDALKDYMRPQIHQTGEIFQKCATDEHANARLLECRPRASDLGGDNQRARQTALHIMDMPDEILILIFQAVRGWTRWGSRLEFCPSGHGGKRVRIA